MNWKKHVSSFLAGVILLGSFPAFSSSKIYAADANIGNDFNITFVQPEETASAEDESDEPMEQSEQSEQPEKEEPDSEPPVQQDPEDKPEPQEPEEEQSEEEPKKPDLGDAELDQKSEDETQQPEQPPVEGETDKPEQNDPDAKPEEQPGVQPEQPKEEEQPAEPQAAPGLVLYATFDEEDVAEGIVRDISGRGNDGTIVGDVRFVPGISGNAASFHNPSDVAGKDGKEGTQYINFGKPQDLQFGTNDFSFALWMKTSGHGQSNSAILSNKAYSNGSNVGFTLGNFSSDNRMNFSTNQGSRAEIKNIPANDDQWHHVAATFDRDGDMVVYLDGSKYGSLPIKGHSATIDAGLDLVLGAGGSKTNAINGCMVDELRMYNLVLDSKEVSELYAAKGYTLELQDMLKTVNSIQVSSLYTEDAIDAIKAAVHTAIEDLEAGSGKASDIIQDIQERYDEFLMGEQPITSFFAVSDVHIRSTDDSRSQDFVKGLDDMYQLDPDACGFLNAGDNTANGSESQVKAFYEIMKKHSRFANGKTMVVLGNHDARGPDSGSWENQPTGDTAYWKTAYDLYMKHNARYMPQTNGKVYYDRWLGGYHFIALNTENGLKDSAHLSSEQLSWLRKQLAIDAKSKKPIFVFVHQALKDTHWRSNILNSFGQQDQEIKNILKDYPQVILMSGHIHNGFGVLEGIPREYGTMVEIPSYSEAENGVTESGTGYYVSIFQDEVVFRARNFKTSTWMPEYNINIQIPALPVLQRRAKALRSSDYEKELWEPVAECIEQAEELMGKEYDQTVISAWDDVRPPQDHLYHPEDWEEINTLSKAFAKSLKAIGVDLDDGFVAEESEFISLRENWKKYLLGGSLDQNNAAVKAYLEQLGSRTLNDWATLNKSSDTGRTKLWDDLDMSYISGVGDKAKEHSGNIAQTFYRLRDLTIAYATEGTELYHNEELKTEIIRALDYMYQNHYNERDSVTPFFGNWWHWEIGAPVAFLSSALILYEDLTPQQIQNYTAAVNRFSPVCDESSGYSGSPAMTGANLIDKGTAVALSGILSQSSGKLEHVKTAFKTVFSYVTTGDGFYEDGSFIQHGALAFMGGYGKSLYEKLSIFFVVMKDSPWELTYEDHAEQLVFDMIFKGIEPFYHQGLFMDMVSGRDITRKGSNDKIRGAELLTAILPMSDAMPTVEMKNRFDSLAKSLILADERYFYENCTNITSVMKASQIVNDSDIEPRGSYVFNKYFGGMDKYVYTTPSYSLGLSMHSNRTYGHELINNEGKRTWNISDGMTYLYTNDRNQFGQGYWATVDPTRLPGTTVEHVVHPNGAGDRTKNVYDWTGGSYLNGFGTAGMHYKALGTGGKRNGADIKKSWFMFGDELVAVGSGITSTTGNTIETIVDNRKIKADTSNTITVDGVSTNALAPTSFQNPKWMHLAGNVDGDDLGYFFPKDAALQVLKEKRTGDWLSMGTTSGEETNSFATFWFDHGAKPVNADYAYVVLPGKTADQTEEYAKNPDIEILANTPSVHAVHKLSAGVTAVNFWTADGEAAGITANQPASVTMRRSDGIVEIAVADPTQQGKTIEVAVPFLGGEVLEKSENITVVHASPNIKISVDTSGLMGASSTIRFAYDAPDTKNVVYVTRPEAIQAAPGTPFKELVLPATVLVLVNDGQRCDVPVSWSRGNYDKNSNGIYQLSGTLQLPKGLFNPRDLTALIDVQVGEVSISAVSDTYLQGGKDANEKGQFHKFGGLVVKNDRGEQHYTRKSLIKFNLSALPSDFEDAYLEFELSSLPADDFTRANIYAVESDWEEETVTFNTMPKRMISEPVAVITRADANQSLRQRKKITQAVRQALADGKKELSLEISIPDSANNNYMEIHSIETSNLQAQVPTISWDQVPDSTADPTERLQMQQEILTTLNFSEFSNIDADIMESLTQKAEKLLADPNSEPDDILAAELEINTVLLSLRRKVEPKK